MSDVYIKRISEELKDLNRSMRKIIRILEQSKGVSNERDTDEVTDDIRSDND